MFRGMYKQETQDLHKKAATIIVTITHSYSYITAWPQEKQPKTNYTMRKIHIFWIHNSLLECSTCYLFPRTPGKTPSYSSSSWFSYWSSLSATSLNHTKKHQTFTMLKCIPSLIHCHMISFIKYHQIRHTTTVNSSHRRVSHWWLSWIFLMSCLCLRFLKWLWSR